MTSSTQRLPRLATLLTVLALALLVLPAVPARAHHDLGFLTPIDFIPDGEVQLLTNDGRVLRGEVKYTLWTFRGLSRFTLREADGTKHRLKAEEVVRLSTPVDEIARIAMAASATTTIEKAAKTDWNQIENVQEFVFDSITWPRAPNRVLLQRLNRGFDETFRIYALTNSKEYVFAPAGIPIAGGEKKAFIVIKNDGAAVKIKKKNYREEFVNLYGDCSEMLAEYPKRDRDFSDFASHIAYYDLVCGNAHQKGGEVTELAAASD